MEDELGLAAREGAGDLPGVGVGDLQVEGQVLTRDLTERLGPADVQGVGVAELAVELGTAGDGLFEVEGVGGVEGGGAVGDAVVADLVESEVDVAVVWACRRRSSAAAGSNLTRASSTSRSTCASCTRAR